MDLLLQVSEVAFQVLLRGGLQVCFVARTFAGPLRLGGGTYNHEAAPCFPQRRLDGGRHRSVAAIEPEEDLKVTRLKRLSGRRTITHRLPTSDLQCAVKASATTSSVLLLLQS